MRQTSQLQSAIILENTERELELCQKLGGDVEKYRRLSFSPYQLEQIRLGLEHGVDTEKYENPELSWMEMENIRYSLETGIDLSKYIKQGFNWLQCNEIREGLEEGQDISFYAYKHFLAPQMTEIRKGLKSGVDVSCYAKPEYDWFQMREIRHGLDSGLDVSSFAKPENNHITMRAIRKAMENGIDLLPYVEKGYTGKELIELWKGFKSGNDIRSFLEQGYDANQLEQINSAHEAGVDITPYLSVELHGVQMEEIIKGLMVDLDVSAYADCRYNWFQMRELRLGLAGRLDVSSYQNPELSALQMAEIRKGLLSGVDVTQYAKLYYDPEQMAEIRKRLEEHDEAAEEEMKQMLAAAEEKQSYISEESEEQGQGAVSRQEEENARRNMQPDALTEIAENAVSVAEDKMSATVYLIEPKEGRYYRVEDVVRFLQGHGVKQGIMEKKIQELLDKKQYRESVVVAAGKEPEDGEDGFFEYHFRRDIKAKPKLLEDGSVDYKNMELFETVEENQLIAEYTPATPGAVGYDVTGRVLGAKKGKELPPIHGKGFDMSEDRKKYVAQMDGLIEWSESDNKIEIRSIYVIPGNVDVSTGNVNFDGDINIMGNVESGFSVWASGNVLIDGRCDAATVHAGKDILIRKGCQGQGEGRLHADGSITGQFFESVELKAREQINASYLLNCNVITDGKLLVQGRRGVIIGGLICARQGIDCYAIGNVAETKTVVEVGIDKKDLVSYQELMKSIAKLESEIATLENAAEKITKQKNKDEKAIALYCRLTKALYTEKSRKKELEEKRQKQMERMDKQRGARVIVNGTIYPGARLLINSEPLVVKKEYTNVEFVKKEGKIDLVNG